MASHRLVPSLVLLLTLVLGGCVDAPRGDAAGAASAEGAGAAPGAAAGEIAGGLVEGTLWLPPSDGEARKETLLELPANLSGMRLVAEVALGSTYGPAELPVTVADVLVELRGPDGDVLADAHLSGGERAATLEGTTRMDGPHTLAFLSYGGSDGQANGDHVRYRVEATSP